MDVTLDVIFACKFFSDVILNVILYHAWRESALRAPKISHELYIYDIHHFQILHGCDSRCENAPKVQPFMHGCERHRGVSYNEIHNPLTLPMEASPGTRL